MALDRKLKGLEPIAIYPDARYRLTWERVPADQVPKCYIEYWIVKYKGKHIADFFKGKSMYFAIIFGKAVIRGTNGRHLAMHISSSFAHPGN
jgi:hypothetical protein